MRIALVNDLAMAVESLRRILLSVPGHEIAWVARDGREAVDRCGRDLPDLILMDLFMPGMDGVEATRRIMAATPCPILIVTATVGNHAAKVFEAMGHGALDAVNIPMMGAGAEAQRSRYTLLRKVHVISRLRGLPSTSPAKRAYMDPPPPIVAIGASTGGPKALADLLSTLPCPLGAAVVIVQHVDEKFSAGLAEWLDGQTPLPVQLAAEGGRPRADVVYLAGTNDHLVMSSGLSFSYTPEPGRTPYRPSVDIFFRSLAIHWPVDPNPDGSSGCAAAIAVLLTGMGRDGAEGLAILRKEGWRTIAQDRATSVVYGMPKAAKELNAAVEILPILEIGPAIVRALRRTTLCKPYKFNGEPTARLP